MLRGSYGVGQYSSAGSSEAHTVICDRGYRRSVGNARPVVYCHSGAGGGLEPWTPPAYSSLPIMQAICSQGVPIGSGDFAVSAWGNDTSQSRFNDMLSFLTANWGVASSTSKRVIILGMSLGGTLALNWARANPTKVACVALFYPAVSLQDCHDGTNGANANSPPSGNYAPSIEAAYGGSLSTFNAAEPSHDPNRNASAYNGVPMKMWYSTVDQAVGTATQTGFAAGVGGSAFQLRALSGASHGDMSAVPASEVLGFVGPYI